MVSILRLWSVAGLVLAALVASVSLAAPPPAKQTPAAGKGPSAEKPAARPAAPAPKPATIVPARIETYVKPDGAGYFALILPPETDLPRVAGHDVVVLVDTSASQVGEAREKGLKALRTIVSLCEEPDRIYLAAVDVNVVPLTSTFVSPKSSELKEGMDRLARRVPLGATDLPLALQRAAAAYSADSTNAKAVVYIGDGVSAAQLFLPAAFAKLVDQLVDEHVPVFGYGLGPRVDGQLLAALANYTGGTIVLDDGQIDPKEAGIFLAASARGPVAWPDAVTWPKSFDEVYPRRLTPLRSDRETVAVGKGVIASPIEIEAKGQVDGEPWLRHWSATPAASSDDFSFLPMLITMAEKDDGVTLPILGAKGLKQIGRLFLATASELIELAKQALKTDNLDDAERLVDEALRRDPNDPDAIALRGEITKRRAEQTPAVVVPKSKPAATAPTTTAPADAAPSAPTPSSVKPGKTPPKSKPNGPKPTAPKPGSTKPAAPGDAN